MKKVFESPELRVMEYQNEAAMSVSGDDRPVTPPDEF